MNIFETQTGFSEDFGPPSPEGTLLSLLTLARDIRMRLGKQGYLLDYYLSLFLEGAKAVSASGAAAEGFECGIGLRSLCFDIIDQDCEKKDYPFNITVPRPQIALLEAMRYQERQTKMNLLYATFFDDFLVFTVKRFIEDTNRRIGIAYDSVKMDELYFQISMAVGEQMMETFNSRLKLRFIIAPLATVFKQGFTNDLLFCLSSRDNETNKQVFQLLMDSVPEYEERK